MGNHSELNCLYLYHVPYQKYVKETKFSAKFGTLEDIDATNKIHFLDWQHDNSKTNKDIKIQAEIFTVCLVRKWAT